MPAPPPPFAYLRHSTGRSPAPHRSRRARSIASHRSFPLATTTIPAAARRSIPPPPAIPTRSLGRGRTVSDGAPAASRRRSMPPSRANRPLRRHNHPLGRLFELALSSRRSRHNECASPRGDASPAPTLGEAPAHPPAPPAAQDNATRIPSPAVRNSTAASVAAISNSLRWLPSLTWFSPNSFIPGLAVRPSR